MEANSIIADPFDVTVALRAMGLTRRGLIEAVRFAESERALCTTNDPKGFDLITMHARLARALRNQFVGEQWESDDTDNQPGIRNAKLKLRVIPCNFDNNAGNPFARPRNLRGKGYASDAKTLCNRTAWLPGLEPQSTTGGGDYQTFVLGAYAADGEPLRAELSKPILFQGGHFLDFKPRFILLDGSEKDADSIFRPDSEGPTDVIDIAVKRK